MTKKGSYVFGPHPLVVFTTRLFPSLLWVSTTVLPVQDQSRNRGTVTTPTPGQARRTGRVVRKGGGTLPLPSFVLKTTDLQTYRPQPFPVSPDIRPSVLRSVDPYSSIPTPTAPLKGLWDVDRRRRKDSDTSPHTFLGP